MQNDVMIASHLRWCNERVLLESGDAPNLSNTMEPRKNDVVFGGKMSKNAGNLHLRSVAKRFSHSYDMASKVKRREHIDHIIKEIHSMGGRFLQQREPNGPWLCVPVEEIHKKVAMMFRNIRRPLLAKRK